MRYIRNNEDAPKNGSLARKLLSKNDKKIRKEIRVVNSNSQGAKNVKIEIVQHILQKRFDLSRW